MEDRRAPTGGNQQSSVQREQAATESGANRHSGNADQRKPARGEETRTSSLAARRGKHFFRAAVVGVASGLVAVAFRESLFRAERTREALLTWLRQYPSWGWAVLPLIGLGIGCLVGWSVRRFSPDAPGSGIPHVKGVLLRVRRMNWRALIPVKFLAGVAAIGAGLSLGREGPTVQLGAAIGGGLGELLRVPKRTLPQLISCGAGAGLAAAFNAPLAGFIFVLEELHRELSALTYGGALIGAVCATIITEAVSGEAPSFSVRNYVPLPLAALPLVALLGVVGGVAGVVFNKSLVAGLRGVEKIPSRFRWILPGIAGIVVGLTAWWLPDAVGGGHAVAERLLNGHMATTVGLLIVLFTAKFVLTSLSYASGSPGGIFAPMLMLGAILGSLFGEIAGDVLPSLSDSRAAFAVLGMAAFFTSSVRAPLTGIVLILEMTGKQEQLFAICVACLAAYLIADRLRDRPIYDAFLEMDMVRAGAFENRAEPSMIVIGVHSGSKVAGKKIGAAGFPRGCLVVGVERSGRELLPQADLELAPGDHITVMTAGNDTSMTLSVVRLCQEYDPAPTS